MAISAQYFNDWYNSLSKPDWTPTPATIGLIWTLLYPIIFVAYGFVFIKIWQGKIDRRIGLPFVLNLLANIAFTPIQFGLRNLPLATVDIIIVLVTIPWAMSVIWPKYRWVAFAQIPYLLWVATATILQVQITLSNH